MTSSASGRDRKSTRLNSSHQIISYAVFCLKKTKNCRGFIHLAKKLTHEVDRLGSTVARLILKGIVGDPDKWWMMWINSFKRDIFFFNDTATTEIYTLSLHDALPI